MKKKSKSIKKNKNNGVFTFYKIMPFGCDIIFYYDKNNNLANKLNNDIIKSKWLKQYVSEFPVSSGYDTGFVLYNKDSYRPLVMYIKSGKKNWDLYETLIHETTHLVNYLEKYFNIEDEFEFRSYLTESIFRDLRRLL